MSDENSFSLRELSLRSPLPVVTFGEISNIFLVHLVNPVVPSPKLPDVVGKNWDWGSMEGLAATDNMWVAVDANWARARAKDAGVSLTEAIYDIINCCGISNVGASKGLKKGLLRSLKAHSFLRADMLHHDGTGFSDNENHPLVLVIKRMGVTDRPILKVVGNTDGEMSIRRADGGNSEPKTAEIVRFPIE